MTNDAVAVVFIILILMALWMLVLTGFVVRG